MALLQLKPTMPFWSLTVENQDLTALLRKYVSSISVTYNENKPATAEITVSSPSFIEGLLTEGMTVGVKMGWNPLSMAYMIGGEIVGRPEGQAAEFIGYTIKIQDKTINMTREEKNRTFQSTKKSVIIKQLISENGYSPVVDILDDPFVKIDAAPIQKKETDLHFLKRCADQWNCVYWLFQDRIYFIDAKKAHQYGDRNRKVTVEDSGMAYPLNYRKFIGTNNVSKIAWKKNASKEGTAGSPGATGAGEKGFIKSGDDYVFEYKGRYWKLTPEMKRLNRENPLNALKITSLIFAANTAETKELHKKYFVPITFNDQTHKSMTQDAAHKGKGLDIEFELNHGDPFLRPPRTALLDCGTTNHDSSDLPSFLFHEGKVPGTFNINEVTTSLQNGMILTKGKMTA